MENGADEGTSRAGRLKERVKALSAPLAAGGGAALGFIAGAARGVKNSSENYRGSWFEFGLFLLLMGGYHWVQMQANFDRALVLGANPFALFVDPWFLSHVFIGFLLFVYFKGEDRYNTDSAFRLTVTAVAISYMFPIFLKLVRSSFASTGISGDILDILLYPGIYPIFALFVVFYSPFNIQWPKVAVAFVYTFMLIGIIIPLNLAQDYQVVVQETISAQETKAFQQATQEKGQSFLDYLKGLPEAFERRLYGQFYPEQEDPNARQVGVRFIKSKTADLPVLVDKAAGINLVVSTQVIAENLESDQELTDSRTDCYLGKPDEKVENGDGTTFGGLKLSDKPSTITCQIDVNKVPEGELKGTVDVTFELEYKTVAISSMPVRYAHAAVISALPESVLAGLAPGTPGEAVTKTPEGPIDIGVVPMQLPLALINLDDKSIPERLRGQTPPTVWQLAITPNQLWKGELVQIDRLILKTPKDIVISDVGCYPNAVKDFSDPYVNRYILVDRDSGRPPIMDIPKGLPLSCLLEPNPETLSALRNFISLKDGELQVEVQATIKTLHTQQVTLRKAPQASVVDSGQVGALPEIAVPTQNEYIPAIVSEAKSQGVPADVALAVAMMESGIQHYWPDGRVKVNGEAVGIMQVTVSTGKGTCNLDAVGLRAPEQNIR